MSDQVNPAARSYGDPCGIARALDAVGDRWALLLVRELVFGPKRFKELKVGLPDASPNVLSQRLKDLEAHGVVRHVKNSLYELTPWGQQLHPLLRELGRWGAQSTARPSGPLSVDALMVALETTFRTKSAGELDVVIGLHIAEEQFTAVVRAGTLTLTRGMARNPAALIACDAASLRALVFGDKSLEEAAVQPQGDARLARRFLSLFARP
jgi:DNA-binding HxlR family transcriptional regulator